ncbi:MAG: glycosyltransferase family 2 protein [Flaviflexus sp.]|uniref:glycosyltransferase family 2 protein n=1 Tax=Flaviflexus sp. TaxID=1969482 RepID=UPI003F919E91
MTSMSLLLDISQVRDASLPENLSLPSIGDIFLIARTDQKTESEGFVPEVSWILVDPTTPRTDRFSLAMQYVTSEWVAVCEGPWPTSLTVGNSLGPRSALLGGSFQTTDNVSASEHEEKTATAFALRVEAYCVVQGFNPAIKNFDRALAEFALRCQLLGWEANLGRTACTLIGPAAEPIEHEENRHDDSDHKPSERVDLIAHLPHWNQKPLGAPPLVSVVIATRNRSAYLKEAINSVRLQTFQDFEILIVADGGSDDSQQIVESIGDPRVRYFWREHGGIAAARNFGADQARGYFTAVHDSDDLMLPNRLELGLKALHDNAIASYGAWVNFDNVTGDMIMHVTKEDFNLDVLSVTSQATGHPTWLIPTWIIRELRYDTRLTSAVDHNLATRTALLGIRWKHVGKAVVLRRIHPEQVSAVDVKNQKLGALLTRQFAITGTTTEAERTAVHRVKERHPWAQVAERANLEKNFTQYLPGQEQSQAIMVTGPLASKLGILTTYDQEIILGSEADYRGKVVRERAWLMRPSDDALADLAFNGYSVEPVQASTADDLEHVARQWVSLQLRDLQRTMGMATVLVGDVPTRPNFTDVGCASLYLRTFDGTEAWTALVPVGSAREATATAERLAIASPNILVSKDVPVTELMAMIGAEIE